jgi:endonuclease V
MQDAEAAKHVGASFVRTDAHDDSAWEGKKEAWTQEQLHLAQRADVPRSEVYGCADAPLRETGEFDEGFVHKRFQLTAVAEALARLQGSGEEDAVASSLSLPNWSALHRQLQWDVAQQVRYVTEYHSVQHDEPQNHTDVSTTRPPPSCISLPALTYIGGVDISFIPGTNDGVACLAILRYPSLEVVQTYMHRCTLQEPYISTFLAFREIQPVRELFDAVRDELTATHTTPQLLIVDGNGVHHPRRCGLATHLGVTLDIPTIGCSKKMLQVDGICREKVEEAFLRDAAASASASAGGVTTLPYVLPLVGATSPAQLYGYAVHGHLNSVKKCIFVSPGHCVGFAVATALVVTMLKHRIPEPIRAADLGSRALIRDSLASAAATASGEDA